MMGAARGCFITLEGIEGVGKSTNLEYVVEHLRAAGMDVFCTREPGGTAAAERIRALLLADDGPLDAMAELLLVFAARASHIAEVIEPALARGTWVVCDRFTDASYAYQGGGRGIDPSVIETLERLVQGPLRPDLTLLLDLPVGTSRARQAGRSGPDRFEREAGEFFERVRNAYLDRASAEPQRIRRIDAAQPLDAVRAEIVRAIEPLLLKQTN